MISMTASSRVAGLLPALVAGAMYLAALPPAAAETVTTVNGVPIDSSVLDLYIQSRTSRPAQQATAEQRDALLRELTDIYLLTTQKGIEEIRNEPEVAAQIELQSRGVLAQAVAGRFFSAVEVTEEDVQAEYKIRLEEAPAVQYKARHILLETQGQAADVITSLDAGGNFEELAKEKSTGPSGPNGGDLGWFSADQMVKPFSDAVAELQDGAYTKAPVQTQFGWHVILREGSRATEAPPLDSLRDELEQRVQQRKFSAYLENLRGNG